MPQHTIQVVLSLVFIGCIISYCIGSLPFGLWVGLLWKRVDIRTLGSKNIGATNVLRVLGPWPALVVFLLDTLKGAAGLLIMLFILPDMAMPYRVVIALCAILGHSFSPFLKFRGGKGVATSLGALLALSWMVAVVGLLVWIVILAITRYVSLASLTAAWSLPFAAHQLLMDGVERNWMVWLGAILAILVTVKHIPNIQRLVTGTESRIGQKTETPNETAEAH